MLSAFAMCHTLPALFAPALRRAGRWVLAWTVGAWVGLLGGPVLAQGWFGGAPAEPGAVVQTDQVRAELVAWAPDGIVPGGTWWAGLRLTHQPHWHTYWKNPGDSGLATQLQWTLPAGLEAGAIDWPAPRKISIGTLANFGYEGTVLLPVPIQVARDFRPAGSTLTLQLAASWLVCKEECVPQEGRFTLQLPAQGSVAMRADEFAATRRSIPTAWQGTVQAVVQDDALRLNASGLPAAWHGKSLNVFPEIADLVETALAPSAADAVGTGPAAYGQQAWQAGAWQAAVPLSRLRSAAPRELALVLERDGQALRVVARVDGTWPAAAVATAAADLSLSPALQAALDNNRAALEASRPAAAPVSSLSWLLALGGALLGGIILNLMPCVFPVLAIKLLTFARADAARQHRAEGLAYTAGVVLAFLGLGSLMLALRAGGEQLGWGFQLQSPAFVAALALLFTLIGLNLVGLLEWRALLPSGLASLQLRHPVADAALSGVLAVAVASPCTAPFMGASLGFAISLPAAQALALFAALGMGLALPFLLASLWPGLARALPRPGPWMATLRTFLAFPMAGTVIWLLWVLGHLVGIDGVVGLLTLLLAMLLVLWAARQPGRTGRGLLALALATLALSAVWLGPSVVSSAAGDPTADTAESAPAAAATPGARWQAWTAQRPAQEVAAGRPVFVDFTAAWCITCQYNKKTTLSDPAVLDDFAQRGVVLLRADWTRRDPAITQALADLGRSGVPVYVPVSYTHLTLPTNREV